MVSEDSAILLDEVGNVTILSSPVVCCWVEPGNTGNFPSKDGGQTTPPQAQRRFDDLSLEFGIEQIS